MRHTLQDLEVPLLQPVRPLRRRNTDFIIHAVRHGEVVYEALKYWARVINGLMVQAHVTIKVRACLV